MKDWIYIGIFLDEESKALLKEEFPTPEDWKEYYDHMTVVFNNGSNIAKLVKEFNEKNISNKFELEITAIGISEKAMAVKVKLPFGVICANSTPHITLCTSSEGKPVDSNNIILWNEIHEAIYVHGTMLTVRS